MNYGMLATRKRRCSIRASSRPTSTKKRGLTAHRDDSEEEQQAAHLVEQDGDVQGTDSELANEPSPTVKTAAERPPSPSSLPGRRPGPETQPTNGRPRGRPPSGKKDPVYLHFSQTPDPQVYRCNECNKPIKSIKGSTSGLKVHWNTHRKQEIALNLQKTRRWIVAGMVTVLNTPCNNFESPIINALFNLANLGPINEKIARRYADAEAMRAVAILIADLQKLRDAGAVFVLTADEWSWRRKRFFGVTLHSSQAIPCVNSTSVDLLKRFKAKTSAKNLFRALTRSLERVGLHIDDIRGLTTDNTLVMRKLGQLVRGAVAPKPFFHQLCLAHALHLAVMDTLKMKNWPSDLSDKDLRGETEDEDGYGESGSENWRFVDMAVFADPDFGENMMDELEVEDEMLGESQLGGHVGCLIQKVRHVCREFNRRLRYHDELARYAEETGCKLKLVLDVETRWASTLRMLNNFLELEDALRRFYANHAKWGAFPFSNEEFAELRGVSLSLGRVEEASKRLSERTIDLRMADIALEMMLEGLRTMRTDFSAALYRNLCLRILQRRGVASRLARFLRRKTETTNIDLMLEDAGKWIMSPGVDKEHSRELRASFAPAGNIVDEIASFIRLQTESTDRNPSSTGNRFEDLKHRNENNCEDKTEGASPELLIQQHKDGAEPFPRALYASIQILQPTSIASERLFSKARQTEGYNQGRESDSRFVDHLLLERYLSQTKPWETLAQGNGEVSVME